MDPLGEKYYSWSGYNYVMDSPVRLVDPDGRVVDLSRLSEEELESYNSYILTLRENVLFDLMYEHLVNSDEVYTVVFGSGEGGGSGGFDPNTNTVYFTANYYAVSQELFHAYQEDLQVYDRNDLAVREAEADLFSESVAMSLGYGAKGSDKWNQGILWTYTDQNLVFTDQILTDEFDEAFSTAVDARIEYYKNLEENEGIEAHATYIQKNSGKGALALKQLVFNMSKRNSND